MMLSKLSSFWNATRALGRLDFRGIPFLPKALLSYVPFNREAYNTFVTEAVRWRLGTAPLIYDVGANNGDFALAVSTVYPTATIVLFEPIQSHLIRLTTLKTVGSFQWIIQPFALGAQSETLDIEVPAGQEAASSLHGFSKAYLQNNPAASAISRQKCEVRKLDDIQMLSGESRRIDLLKIDVEGFEFSVLAGAEKTLLRVDRMVVEVSRLRHNDEPGCPVARMVQTLGQAGLSLFRMQPTIFNDTAPFFPLEYDLYFCVDKCRNHIA